ncbi:uncharacterized protein LOC118505887 isoform X4 [Anopheles stephensi]|uniref:uncharacterized protein LOC118505887 isoform X4 n=1 Tax=Anopheles stephensi TaxID=30069 RepID=UPI001658A9E1|nr:uncharacterized protein LOC118505887 isoform X4 [Anopheles stephensi]
MTGEIVTFAIGMIVCVPFSGDELSDETPKLPNMSASTSNEGKRKPMSHRLSPISAQVGVSTETATIYGAGMSRCHKTLPELSENWGGPVAKATVFTRQDQSSNSV